MYNFTPFDIAVLGFLLTALSFTAIAILLVSKTRRIVRQMEHENKGLRSANANLERYVTTLQADLHGLLAQVTSRPKKQDVPPRTQPRPPNMFPEAVRAYEQRNNPVIGRRVDVVPSVTYTDNNSSALMMVAVAATMSNDTPSRRNESCSPSRDDSYNQPSDTDSGSVGGSPCD